ncbi:MAG TPA: EAL domain-containing protein [Syntrophorhabdaceae bacterium]|nr:EAL domain-containing protein [Syntrophorhabdaceae bacterium]HPP06490.1 EAL domain-containing protein [Syntrophorhabdaceae bacterium]
MEKVYVGRQPIINKKEVIFGFELLFRSGTKKTADVLDSSKATATVIIHSLNDLGFNNIIGRKKGFINVNYEILSSGFLELLPNENTVFEILEDVKVTHSLVEICKSLKSKGYLIALDDFTYHDSQRSLMEIADFIKIDILAYKREELPELVRFLKSYPPMLLAEKVETKEDFSFCIDLGFELFQGYFFERPTVIEGTSISSSQLILLELFNELSREKDVEIIENLFKKNPELDIKLLNFINSAAFYHSQKITSIRQGIIILGYRNLQKWIALMLFSKAGLDIKSNPLLERAAFRGFFMELMANKITKNRNTGDQAFIVGILSVSDALMNMKIEDIVKKLNITEEIKNALLNREGLLGDILALVEMLEKNEPQDTDKILKKYKLSQNEIYEIETKAIMQFERMDTKAN